MAIAKWLMERDTYSAQVGNPVKRKVDFTSLGIHWTRKMYPDKSSRLYMAHESLMELLLWEKVNAYQFEVGKHGTTTKKKGERAYGPRMFENQKPTKEPWTSSLWGIVTINWIRFAKVSVWNELDLAHNKYIKCKIEWLVSRITFSGQYSVFNKCCVAVFWQSLLLIS